MVHGPKKKEEAALVGLVEIRMARCYGQGLREIQGLGSAIEAGAEALRWAVSILTGF